MTVEEEDNLAIDRKLAKAMGIEVEESKTFHSLWIMDGEMNDIWNPVNDMAQAWKVAERFGFKCLRKSGITGQYNAFFGNQHITYSGYAVDESAPLAICKAALKVIEGSKSDE